MEFSIEQINLYKSIFKGRDDVYAVRWEKGGKSGYMPTYSFDPYMYKLHRMKGGTFQNYSDKKYQPFTEEQIFRHLNGEQLIGLYPLLKDNTSWFIAADFDESDWEKECKSFINICNEKGIPAYLERSRSGKGGHVWIFFENSYPAFRSRKIFIALLQQFGLFSIFDKHPSFDRLFPNQDYLSGKGLGNLIALPLHKTALENGNSCFIDPETLLSVPNQWEFLKNIERVTIEKLDRLYQELTDQKSSQISSGDLSVIGKPNIRLNNAVSINRSGLSTPLITFLKEELNFANSEYIIKKKLGKSSWGTERYFKLIEETENHIVVPRGFIGKLIRFLREQKIEYDFVDERKKSNQVIFNSEIQLREYQKPSLEITTKRDFGVIIAPPGSGKTIIGLSIIAEKSQPALIIVHRKQLAEQWMDRLESFLGIPKRDIGRIGQGKIKLGKQITVALIQSLTKAIESKEIDKLRSSFGTIIIDECHHVPAESFRNTISKFHSYYLYGLTATPFRKYNDGKIIFIHLGDIITEIKPQDIQTNSGAKIIIRNTELSIPFNSKTDRFETLSKILVHDSTRNKLILEDVVVELEKGKKVVIVTERKDHIDSIQQYLKQKYETVTLSGDDTEKGRNFKWKVLQEGNFQVLITTGQYFGEGSDLQKIECLFLVYPFAFEGKLIQYIGRVQRSEITPTIYDYRDYRIEYLEKLFQKRNTFYKKIYLQGTLFDQPKEENHKERASFKFEQRISIPVDQLEFRFGAIAFKHLIPEMKCEVEFEVENTEMRPEFEVLKSYFSKILKAKKVKVDALAKFENGSPIFHSASSNDLNKINRELIDSVKFRFISKGIIGKIPTTEENLLDINQIQNGENNQMLLYNSEQELMNDILKNKNVRHYRQLVYLSQKHENSILKLRFVLSPFSFVFLISGKQQYHIVWETLDTEEATYIWHVEKNISLLKKRLAEIDRELATIRTKGRQHYMELDVKEFNRIVHDYSDDRKGFVIWKDMLEERLV